ncbi:hypothetical protein [Ruegeria sp.]|uniref:hypothetical protein n=1 Tax=Ruegeria sp. TaxID=1879320 RepID=UPI003C7A6BB6
MSVFTFGVGIARGFEGARARRTGAVGCAAAFGTTEEPVLTDLAAVGTEGCGVGVGAGFATGFFAAAAFGATGALGSAWGLRTNVAADGLALAGVRLTALRAAGLGFAAALGRAGFAGAAEAACNACKGAIGSSIAD